LTKQSLETRRPEIPGNEIVKMNMKIAYLVLSFLLTEAKVTGQMISSSAIREY